MKKKERDGLNIVMNILLILIGIFLFALIIFSHEFGHFFTAKLCKIKVNEFAVGMGPKIFSKRKGETRYSLRLLPIGGYCAMEGEDEDSDDARAFGNRPVWQRMIVLVAGGVMNVLLGIIMMAVLLSTREIYGTTQIASIEEDSPLVAAGLREGDEIRSVDGYKIYVSRDLTFGLAMAENPDSVDFEVRRDGEIVRVDDVQVSNTVDEDGNTTVIYDFTVYGVKTTVGNVITRSFKETYSMVRMVVASLKGIVTGQFGLNDLAGPVGTAQMIAEAASEGLLDGFGSAVNNILLIMVLITVNLGIVNLLPIPALDGGRLLFLLFELIFRKPVPAKYEGWVHTVGFVLLIGLMVIVAFNDIVRIVTGG